MVIGWAVGASGATGAVLCFEHLDHFHRDGNASLSQIQACHLGWRQKELEREREGERERERERERRERREKREARREKREKREERGEREERRGEERRGEERICWDIPC